MNVPSSNIALNQWNSFLFRSHPSDVARVEDRTYIAPTQDEAGPTNNWIDPVELKKTMRGLYKGCMKGRTMYVIPFSMGPSARPSPRSASNHRQPYVVVNMHIMTRVGDQGDRNPRRRRRVHSLPALRRRAAEPGQKDSPGPARRSSRSTSPISRKRT
jgi:phosphoenolpyruvate carboxykinase (GTP)